MKICVIGSDVRFEYIKECFENDQYTLCDVDKIEDCNIIIFPLPVSRDGVHINCNEQYKLVDIIPKINTQSLVLCGPMSKEVSLMFYLYGVKPIEYSNIEEFAIRNAHATAEAALLLTMRSISTTLLNKKCLVVGYGRIGKFLSKMLKDINADVTVGARSKKDFALLDCLGYKRVNSTKLDDEISKYEIIINTVDHKIIPLQNISENTVVIELAGINVDYYNQLKDKNCKVIDGKALPAKYAIDTAKEILYNTIKNIIEEEMV